MDRETFGRDCPICKYPMKEMNTIVFGLLYKCLNSSCKSKRFGDTARSMEEMQEIKNLLRNFEW